MRARSSTESDEVIETSWEKSAACKGLDPHIFYPPSEEDAASAKAVCDVCAVRIPCLEHALSRREKDGVWGGATEKERRRIVRQRRRERSQQKSA